VANNNYPQITSITSEALQAQIRNLLPSQEGFGTDLMAQNVIVPIIDLTSAAEGSSVPQNLQTALAFGSQTSFAVNGATSTIINNTGFFRIFGSYVNAPSSSAFTTVSFGMTDGLSSKNIWQNEIPTTTANERINGNYDFVVFCAAGISVTARADANSFISGSTRQIADINGVLINPVGFNPQ
jgi:hypothetical protein